MCFPLTLIDARRETVHLERPPRRIVSLVPSQTELLAHLGLDEEVVGLTRFCVHPEDWKARKTIVGGTKQVRFDRIGELEPDLVLANYEENTREIVETLDAFAPVYVTDVGNVNEALTMIRTVGRVVDRAGRAVSLAEQVAAAFDELPEFEPLRAAYFIWREPYMSVGRDTIIHDVMTRAGLVNVFGDKTRYPQLTPDEIAEARPDVVLLSSEPYPFSEEHAGEVRTILPDVPAHLVDGELFSWYGPRLLRTPPYLRRLREGAERRGGGALGETGERIEEQ